MKIERRILKKPVVISGYDIFGRPSSLIFKPFPAKGWYWEVPVTSDAIPTILPISFEWVSSGLQNICLEYEKQKFRILEHILPLRLLGIDGVLVSIKGGHSWPPYLTTQETLDFFEGACVVGETAQIERFCPVTERVEFSGKFLRSTAIEPIANLDEIRIEVDINYQGIGHYYQDFVIDTELLKKVFPIGPQGWPKWRYFASKALGWKHHKRVVWPQEQSNTETGQLFLLHRVVDILGFLCSLEHARIPGGIKVTSILSGHAIDVGLGKKIMHNKKMV